MKVSEFMTKDVIYLTPKHTVEDAAKLMLEKNISVVPIVDSAAHLIGIITESDFVGKDANIPHALVALKRLFGQIFYSNGVEDIFQKSKNVPLENVMTKNPKTVELDYTLDDVINMMIHYKIKRLPVIQNGKLKGMVTRHDVLRAFTLLKPQLDSHA